MKQIAVIGSPALHQNYQSALESVSCKAVIFPDSSCLEKHPDAFDGLLLPGGGDVPSSLSEYASPGPGLLLDLEQLQALHFFHKRNKPILGICKGMQLINLYFHGTIREVSDKDFHQNPEKDNYHPAENLPGSFLHALFGSRMLVNSNHHQCIDAVGRNLQIIQRAPDKTPEAIAHLTSPVIGTQWHPERMPKLPRQDAILLFRYFISLL